MPQRLQCQLLQTANPAALRRSPCPLVGWSGAPAQPASDACAGTKAKEHRLRERLPARRHYQPDSRLSAGTWRCYSASQHTTVINRKKNPRGADIFAEAPSEHRNWSGGHVKRGLHGSSFLLPEPGGWAVRKPRESTQWASPLKLNLSDARPDRGLLVDPEIDLQLVGS